MVRFRVLSVAYQGLTVSQLGPLSPKVLRRLRTPNQTVMDQVDMNE